MSTNDAVAKRDNARSIAMRAEVVSCISAVVALISAFLTFKVANDTNSNNTANVVRQLAGETDRSRSEFTRTQRELAYGQFVTETNNVLGDLAKIYDSARLNIAKSALSAQFAKESTDHTAWRNSHALVNVIGSRGVSDLSNAFFSTNQLDKLASDAEGQFAVCPARSPRTTPSWCS